MGVGFACGGDFFAGAYVVDGSEDACAHGLEVLDGADEEVAACVAFPDDEADAVYALGDDIGVGHTKEWRAVDEDLGEVTAAGFKEAIKDGGIEEVSG